MNPFEILAIAGAIATQWDPGEVVFFKLIVILLIVAVNARHSSAVKVSTGPLRSVVSRTSTASGEATSTHSPPLSPE